MDVLSQAWLTGTEAAGFFSFFSLLFLVMWRFLSQVQQQLRDCESNRNTDSDRCLEEKKVLTEERDKFQKLYFDTQGELLRERRQAIERLEGGST